MLASISDSLTGIVTPMHYSDIILKHPERKFQIGRVVKARVLFIDPKSNKVKLTLKKSLLSPDINLLTRFEDARTDMIATGTVFRILNEAILVEYFGDVKSYIGISELRLVHSPMSLDVSDNVYGTF